MFRTVLIKPGNIGAVVFSIKYEPRRGEAIMHWGAGESFSQLKRVQEMGLNYVKIDSAFMADIDENSANHAFLRGFCSLAHTFGIKVYVDGIKRSDTQELFVELGIDGVVSHIEIIEHLLDD